MRSSCVNQMGCTRTRTGTRPPPVHTTSPCPYRNYPVRSSKFIKKAAMVETLYPAMRCVLAAQHLFVEFADAGFGDGFYEFDAVGQPPFGDVGAQVFDNLFGCHLPGVIGFGDDEGPGALVPFGMGQADDAGLQYLWVAHNHVFQVNRGDPFAARLHEVFGAVNQLDDAVLIDDGHIAGTQPAVEELLAGGGVLEVRLRDPGAAHLQLAESFVVPGDFLAGFDIHDAELDAGDDGSLARAQ